MHAMQVVSGNELLRMNEAVLLNSSQTCACECGHATHSSLLFPFNLHQSPPATWELEVCVWN